MEARAVRIMRETKKELLQKLLDTGYSKEDVDWFAKRSVRFIKQRLENDETHRIIQKLASKEII